MVDNLSIAFNTFARHILTSLSVDEILMAKHVNWSINLEACYAV